MNSSGSSSARSRSTRSIGKRMSKTRFSWSDERYFLKNGLSTSQAFFFSFFALWVNSIHNSLSPRIVMVSFINCRERGACIYVLLFYAWRITVARFCVVVIQSRDLFFLVRANLSDTVIRSCIFVIHCPCYKNTFSPYSITGHNNFLL